MSLTEPFPSVQALPRMDKLRLVQELISELPREEGISAGEYSVWSPYDSHDAAAMLMQLLEQDENGSSTIGQILS